MYIRYMHHKHSVVVHADAKGKHREHCLCYRCNKFYPGTAENCQLAELIYGVNVAFGLTTPVWECPRFYPQNTKHPIINEIGDNSCSSA